MLEVGGVGEIGIVSGDCIYLKVLFSLFVLNVLFVTVVEMTLLTLVQGPSTSV